MTTSQMTKRQQLEIRTAILEKLVREIRSNIESRKALAGPQQPGDVDAKWGKSNCTTLRTDNLQKP